MLVIIASWLKFIYLANLIDANIFAIEKNQILGVYQPNFISPLETNIFSYICVKIKFKLLVASSDTPTTKSVFITCINGICLSPIP